MIRERMSGMVRSGVGPDGPVVKICGLTRMEDVRTAADAGAWALGFVFAPSPRCVTGDQAAELIGRLRADAPARAGASGVTPPLAVGVFGDVAAEEIARMAAVAGLDAVQLHGAQGPSAGEVRRALAGAAVSDGAPGFAGEAVLIIEVVAVDPDRSDAAELRGRIEVAAEGADLLLLDTRSGGRSGGTGRAFPWTVAREAAAGRRFLVAGGITPANVRQALDSSGAWGADISSGVEAGPGVKDPELIERLFEVVIGIGCAETRRAAEALPEGMAR